MPPEKPSIGHSADGRARRIPGAHWLCSKKKLSSKNKAGNNEIAQQIKVFASQSLAVLSSILRIIKAEGEN